MKKAIFTLLMLFILTLTTMADAVGTWRVYSSYSNITSIEPAGSKVFVLADGNLFSYNATTTEIRTYDKTSTPALNSSDITHILWVKSTGKLLIVYANYLIDLLSDDGIASLVALQNVSAQKDRTVNSVAVNGKYAFLTTGIGVLKIDTKDEYVVNTYSLNETVPDMPSATGSTTTKEGPDGTVFYDSVNKCYWGANADGKLTKYMETDGTITAASTGIAPDGPAYREHTNIKYHNGKLYSVRGLYEGWGAAGDIANPGYLQVYDIAGNTWTVADNTYATEKGKTCATFTCIDVDPRDNSHVVVGAKSGLFEYRNGKMTAFYDCESGTPIKSTLDDTYDLETRRANTVISAVKFDSSGNLWVFNQGNTVMICLTASGEWTSPKLTGITEMARYKTPMFDSRGLLWLSNDFWRPYSYGFYDTKSNQFRFSSSLTNQDGTAINVNGPLGKAVAEDKENNIWYATNDGPFYLTPSDVQYMCNNTDLSDMRINQYKVNRNDGSGLADYLLAGVSTTDVVIDASNRKWFASAGNGLYCISADSNTELEHFTTENSPLPTNEIKKLALDETTGVLYIGTYYGLCSYQTDITDNYGSLSNDGAYAYPNPVSPDHTGSITIMGLTTGAIVTITNTAGYIVHRGTTSGPSYQWNGRDLSGRRVASGVYNVLVATSDGESGCVTKIAMIK